MPAGSIVVELLAKTGSFETDVQRSTKAAEKRMKDFANSVKASFAGNLLAGFAEEAISKITALPGQIVHGLDALNDVSDATGASIEKISALEDTALRTGNSFESVSSALVKFNQELKDTDPNNKTSAILQKIGLNAQQLRQIDPADALHQVARALAQFADDGDKARVVQELFGKSVREVAPLLKDLAEQEQLHATVTTDEAKAAEEFNKQLAQMNKNSLDLARSIAGGLLPEINALLKAFREGGAVGGLMGFGDVSEPGKKLTEINDKLITLRKTRDELDPKKSTTNKINDFLFGDVGDLDRQISALEKEQKFLKSLQQTQALGVGGDVSDALSRRMGSRAGIGPIPDTKKGPKGKDPNADFNSYLSNLQQQLQKVNELTVSEKLLDDIRRGSLTVTPAQEKQLKTLAATIDKEKEATEARKLSRDAVIDEGAAVNKANEAYQDRLKALLDAGPMAQLERQRRDLQFLADQIGKEGGITAEQFSDAATGMLGLNQAAQEGIPIWEELGSAGLDALHSLALGGEDVDEVFKRLLLRVADLIFQIGVVEPAMEQLRASMKGSGTSGGGGLFQTIAGSILAGFGGGGVTPPNPFYGGARAGGGDVLPGVAYDVGELGRERFIPRTAGTVLPNSAIEGGGELMVVNQTSGRVDRAVEQRISPKQKALFLQETIEGVALAISNPSSSVNKSIKRNFNVRPHRS